jgi:hypothetical protein
LSLLLLLLPLMLLLLPLLLLPLMLLLLLALLPALVHMAHDGAKLTVVLNVPSGHRHRLCTDASLDVSLDVTVPAGHGEHWVLRFTAPSVTSTSLLLLQIISFHTEPCTGCRWGCTTGALNPGGVLAVRHLHREGCSSTANRLSPEKAMLTKFIRPPRPSPPSPEERGSIVNVSWPVSPARLSITTPHLSLSRGMPITKSGKLLV